MADAGRESAVAEALAATREALRREIGPPTDQDRNWQPMVSAYEIRLLLDALDALDTPHAQAEAVAAVERVRELADALEAEFDSYRLDDPIHLRLRAALTPGQDPPATDPP